MNVRQQPWMRLYRNTGENGGGNGGAGGGGAPAGGGGNSGDGGAGGGTPPANGQPPAGQQPQAGQFPALRPGAGGNNGGNGAPNGDPANGQQGQQPEPKPYEQYHGAPEGDATYTELKFGEGFSADKALIDKFSPIAKELNLSQAGLQKLADFYANEVVGPQSKSFVDQIAGWFEQTEKDPEIGGANFDKMTENSGKALRVFGTPGLKTLMVQYGLGNHPEVLRFFHRVGGAIAEDNSGGGGDGGKAGQDGEDFLTLMYGPPRVAGQ